MKTDIVLRLLISFFKRLGLSIGTHPLRYLGISLILSLLPLAGLYRFKMSDDIRTGYSKEGSRSVRERNTYCEFFECSSPVYAATLIGTAVDGRSMIREAHLEEFLVVFGIALNNITTVVHGYPFAMKNLTNHAAFSYHILRLFLDGIKEQNAREASGLSPNPNIILDFPHSYYYSQKVSMSNVMYGVTRATGENENENATGSARLPYVEHVAAAFLVERGDEETFAAVKEIELRISDMVINGHQSNLVSFEVLGDEVVNREVVRGAKGSVVYFLVGLLVMIVFVTFTVVDWRLGVGAFNWMTALLVSTTILSPLLAAGAVFGLLSAFGQPINSMMCIMPFLLLGIGVDDAFLMIYGWRKLTERGMTGAERLSRTFEEVGPSITITSLTNVLAFGVGALSASPAIRAFCVCTTLALVVDFVLEIAFFGAVVAVACGEPHREDEKPTKNPFLKAYCKFLTSWPVRIATLVFLLALWWASTLGILQLVSKFSPEKTFDKQSRLVHSFAIADDMYRDHENTLIIVNRPPHIDDEADLALFNAAVHDFRSFRAACDSPALTTLWLEDYAAFDKEIHDSVAMFGDNSTYRFSYDDVPEFLSASPGYQAMVHWSYDEQGAVVVSSFCMEMCSSGSHSWAGRADKLTGIREVIDRYPSFNMSAFVFDSTIFDMILSTASVTIQSSLITLASMVVICALFIPNFTSVVMATASIVSMILAVVGFLSWWNCDMDIITMVDILMAVGFTVDFTAHMTYHYAKSGEVGEARKEERLYEAFSSVGYPMLQAGFSTALCVVPLLFYDVYMYRTFVKTIFLTTSWGMLHGLVLLPVVLAVLPDRYSRSIIAPDVDNTELKVAADAIIDDIDDKSRHITVTRF